MSTSQSPQLVADIMCAMFREKVAKLEIKTEIVGEPQHAGILLYPLNLTTEAGREFAKMVTGEDL